MASTISACLAAMCTLWWVSRKRYHAAALGEALKATASRDTAPAPVLERLFRHYEALLARGCTQAEIHALVIQSFHPDDHHHLRYIQRVENSHTWQCRNVPDAVTLMRYIDSMRRVKERCYPHICGRERRHPRPRMLSPGRI